MIDSITKGGRKNLRKSPNEPFQNGQPPRTVFLVFLLITAALWVLLSATAQFAKLGFGQLDAAGARVSGQAMSLVQDKDSWIETLASSDSPLTLAFTYPFAIAALRDPSIWASSLAGALFISSLLIVLRGHVANTLVIAVPLIIGLVQPSLVYRFISGSPTALVLFLSLFSVYFLIRFTLEHDIFKRRKKNSENPSWAEDHLFLNERIKFLWAFALIFAAASLVRPWLIAAVPIIAIATPLLIDPTGWRRSDRNLSLAILLLLPVIAAQLSMLYLRWAYAPDTFYESEEEFLFYETLTTHASSEIFLALTAITFLPFFWILIRLRNIGIILVTSAIPIAGLSAHALGIEIGTSLTDLRLFCFFIALILISLASDFRIVSKVETYLLSGALSLAGLSSMLLFILTPLVAEFRWISAGH